MPTTILPYLLKNKNAENLSDKQLLIYQQELIQWYQSFHANSTDVFFVVNQEGYLVYVSKVFEIITGESSQEYIAKHFRDFTHPDDHARLDQLQQNILQGKLLSLEFTCRFLTLLGKELHFNVIVYSVSNTSNQFLYFGGNARLIDEELRMKSELNKARKIRELLVNKVSTLDELAQNNWDATVQSVIGECAQLLLADKAYILVTNQEKTQAKLTHEWLGVGIAPTQEGDKNIDISGLRRWYDIVYNEKAIVVSDVEKASSQAPELKELLSSCQVKSIIIAGLVSNNQFLGVIVFESVNKIIEFEEADVELVKSVGNNLAHYLYIKKYQEKNRHNEELLNAFAENSSEGFAIVKGAEILYTSPAYRKILGYPESNPIWSDLPGILQLIHPEDVNKPALLKAAIEQQKTFVRYQFRIKHYLKHYIWQEDIVSIEYHAQGPPTCYIISRDITQEIKINQELEINKHKYQSLIDAVPDLLMIITKNGEYKEIFSKPHHKLRYKTHYLLGKTISEIYGKELHEEFLEAVKSLQSSEQKIIVRTYKLPATSVWPEQHFEVRLVKYFDDILLIERDISEFTRTQQTLEQERIKLKTIVNALPNLIYMKDVHGRKVFANTAERKFLNISEEDVLGQTDFDFLTKEEAQESSKEDRSVLNKGISIKNKEVFVNSQAGNPFWLQITKLPLRDENNNIIGLVGISNNITELKNKEDELRKAVDVMASQNKRLQNFTYIVSHNIRSYASNISGLLELYKLEEDADERTRYIDLLNASSKSLLDTINNLNEVISVQNAVNIHKDTLNLNQVIHGIFDTLKFDINQHNVIFHNKIPELTMVRAPAAYLESILLNLITNAIKYRDEKRDPEIEIALQSTEHFYIVTVKDNGLGIDIKRHGHKIFGMYQVFHSKKDARGLGLFIVKNQIESIGGSIAVESVVGVGSTFRVSFPIF